MKFHRNQTKSQKVKSYFDSLTNRKINDERSIAEFNEQFIVIALIFL